MYKCGMLKTRNMLATDGSKGNEDEHWIARARYHFRMEEYWRDRALSAERELEQMKKSSDLKNRVKNSSKRNSRCCN